MGRSSIFALRYTSKHMQFYLLSLLNVFRPVARNLVGGGVRRHSNGGADESGVFIWRGGAPLPSRGGVWGAQKFFVFSLRNGAF